MLEQTQQKKKKIKLHDSVFNKKDKNYEIIHPLRKNKPKQNKVY